MFEDDGNWVIRSASNTIEWESNSHCPDSTCVFKVENDGNVILYDATGEMIMEFGASSNTTNAITGFDMCTENHEEMLEYHVHFDESSALANAYNNYNCRFSITGCPDYANVTIVLYTTNGDRYFPYDDMVFPSMDFVSMCGLGFELNTGACYSQAYGFELDIVQSQHFFPTSQPTSQPTAQPT